MPLAAGTIALYRFENNGLDASPSAHDLGVVGSPPFGSPSPDAAYPTYTRTLDLINYFTIPASLRTALQGLSTWEIGFYIHPQSNLDNEFVVSLNNGNFEILRLSNLTLRSTNNFSFLDAGSLDVAGGFRYCQVSCDGINRKIYIDGFLAGSTTGGLALPASITNGFIGIKDLVSGDSVAFLDSIRFSSVDNAGSAPVDTQEGINYVTVFRRSRR